MEDHLYMIMLNEQVIHTTNDINFFITLIINESNNLNFEMDKGNYKSYRWVTYTDEFSDKIIIHFITTLNDER